MQSRQAEMGPGGIVARRLYGEIELREGASRMEADVVRMMHFAPVIRRWRRLLIVTMAQRRRARPYVR